MANNPIEKLMKDTAYGDTPGGPSSTPGGPGITPSSSQKGQEIIPVKQSTLTTLLVEGIKLDDSDCDDEYSGSISADSGTPLQTFGMDHQNIKPKIRPPTLVEVMLDPDFIEELRGGSVSLKEFLTFDKLLELCDFVIVQPGFNDNPSRCFKLPFIACEALTSEVFAITKHLFKETEADF